jgi:hypothetical protein
MRDPFKCHRCEARGAWQLWSLKSSDTPRFVCSAHVMDDLKNIGRGQPFVIRGVPVE